jgi:hypothetical protein
MVALIDPCGWLRRSLRLASSIPTVVPSGSGTGDEWLPCLPGMIGTPALRSTGISPRKYPSSSWIAGWVTRGIHGDAPDEIAEARGLVRMNAMENRVNRHGDLGRSSRSSWTRVDANEGGRPRSYGQSSSCTATRVDARQAGYGDPLARLPGSMRTVVRIEEGEGGEWRGRLTHLSETAMPSRKGDDAPERRRLAGSSERFVRYERIGRFSRGGRLRVRKGGRARPGTRAQVRQAHAGGEYEHLLNLDGTL